MMVFLGDDIMAEKYPMTYEEYEKRVIELWLELYPEDKQSVMKEIVDDALKEDPTLISALYGNSCFCYAHPEIYGEVCKKEFEDSALKSIPVRNLDMLIGGNID